MDELKKDKLATTYAPQEVEQKWYQIWKEKGYFSCDNNKDGEPFCIVMPPPNVTGQLHMGHFAGCADSVAPDAGTPYPVVAWY